MLFGRLALEAWKTSNDLVFLATEVGKFFLGLESVGVMAYRT